ncbi:MAG: cation diffusion facilitator family transporter [Bacteroidales bacterium]|jgi:cobalt-zinc-cadmium efflux system protein|nr:cation diffusion facilitator family transporter [Bacteroidales bacterium]
METHLHHEHNTGITSLNGIYIISIIINFLFVIIEAAIGFKADSLGLLSDAGHNLGDVFSLLLAMIAFKLASSHGTKRFTYGYRKSSVLISLLNAIILLIAVGAIIIESIHKLSDPGSLDVNGQAVSWTAGIGIIVNGVTALLLMKQQKHDLNTRGAFLHMIADTLVSIGVVISGIVITVTGWSVIDPVISLIIAGIILITTWNLLSESLKMSIDAVPQEINTDEIMKLMESESGVTNIHHLHIWAISTTEIALTAHVVIDNLKDMDEITADLKRKLNEKGIDHTTLQIERQCTDCHDEECC